MTAAVYAALVSLLNTMDQIQNHPRLSTCFDKYQNELLRENIDFFMDFVENYSDYADNREAEDLVRQITVVFHEAEDIIECQAAHQIRAGSTRKSITMLLHLQRIIQEMNSIKEKVINIAKKETEFINNRQSTYSMCPSPSSLPLAPAKTNTMVGFDGYLAQLLDQLIGQQSDRRIIPIVGMGGIGKTTLARNVFDNLLTLHHFDVRTWVTVTQEFKAREIILQALSCLGASTIKMDTIDGQPGEELYKILFGRRYLIVLDDVWSVEAWEKIKFFFPENNNGSRIVITTRLSELVDYFGSYALALDFLDDKDSWELFCDKAFVQKGCPYQELEPVGKKIINKCKGLPLAITVIGGLLRKSPRTQEYWEIIAKDKSLIMDSEEGNKPLSILYMTYKHLPIWLKSCFLYLGLFPEDDQIDVPRLIKLWVAEGFIKPNTNQSLEEVAEGYVKNLVDRNLLLVRRVSLTRKFRTCCIHDLVRDLCIRIAEKENFYYVQRDMNGMRHFIVDQRTARFCSLTSQTPSLINPLVFHGQRPVSFKSRLLRVLARDMGRLDCPFREVNLRFLCHDYVAIFTKLPSSISLLWCLQTLIVDHILEVFAPCEIWKMAQLRHIETWSICVDDPPPSPNGDIIKKVHNLNLTEDVCKRIPNIKDLQVHYNFHEMQGMISSCYHLNNVGCLNKLESLQYSCKGLEPVGGSLQNLKLPSSLKELTLQDCKLVWSDMAMIGLLPHLEILQLLENAVVGSKWKPVEKQFLCLKHLRIQGCYDLIYWIADSSNFPVLETLYLLFLSKLDEIPSDIGEIHTLHRIFMYDCSKSASISAIKILEEQESLGNQGLQLELEFFDKIEAELLKLKIQELGFTCQNLLINGNRR